VQYCTCRGPINTSIFPHIHTSYSIPSTSWNRIFRMQLRMELGVQLVSMKHFTSLHRGYERASDTVPFAEVLWWKLCICICIYIYIYIFVRTHTHTHTCVYVYIYIYIYIYIYTHTVYLNTICIITNIMHYDTFRNILLLNITYSS